MKNLNQAVVTFNYPNIIVMKNTRNKDIVNFCQQTVLHIVDRMRTLLNNTNLKCTIMGHSAGVYFATRVLTSNQSEVFTSIDRFVGICGYYGARTVNNNVLKLLDKLYLNDKPLDLASFITVRTKQQLRNSDVIPQIPFVIDQLYITTTDDFLRDSTMTYTSQLDCSGVLTYRGEHNLFHRPENAQAKEMYARIVEFVNVNWSVFFCKIQKKTIIYASKYMLDMGGRPIIARNKLSMVLRWRDSALNVGVFTGDFNR